MRRPMVVILTGLIIAVGNTSGWGETTKPSPAIDPKADEILKKMGKCLAETRCFSVKADKMADYVLENGQKVQLSSITRVIADRPGRLWARTTGDTGTEQAWYSGKLLTVLNEDAKTYSPIEVPETIDKMMDFVVQKFGWSLPLADLVFSDPYQSAMEKVRSGLYLGIHSVNEIRCHHLAFRQDGLDWQIWIDAGDRPLPRKLVITDKDAPGYPQFIALLNDWDLAPKLAENQFAPKIPDGTTKVEAENLKSSAAPNQTAPK
jgi:hypothetical protein